MATKIKYTEKELKQPDEFNKTIARIIDFTSDHSKKILIALGVIIVVIVSAFLINSSSESTTAEANNMFDAAADKFYAGDTEGALQGFLEVEKEYSGQGIANVALYYAAIINFDNGDYEQSLNLLSQFEAKELGEPMLIDSADFTRGLAYFNQNEWQQAIDYLSKIADSQSPYQAQAKLHMAMSYENLGDTDRANLIYNELIQDQPNANPGVSVNRVQ